MTRNVWRAILTHTGASSSWSHVINPPPPPVGRLRKSNRIFVALEKSTETADLLLRCGREFIACNVLSYDMRFSVLSLNSCSASYTPSSVVHAANLEITQGV